MSQAGSFVFVPSGPGRSNFVPPPGDTFGVETRRIRFSNLMAGFRFGFPGFTQLALGRFGPSSSIAS